MAKTASEEAWVAATIAELRRVGSWTGRIHVHKVLYLASALRLAKPPFQFELHQYGPYSFDLDREIASMEVFGLLSVEYRRPGYGPQYQVTQEGQSASAQLPPRDRKVVARIVDEVGKSDSKALELIATCLWVIARTPSADDDEIIETVGRIKPRYSDHQIRQSLQRAKGLEQRLKAA